MMTQPITCVICDAGVLTPELYSDVISYNGNEIQVHNLERCRCSNCGSDPVLPEQIRRNQLRITDAKRIHDGLLTGEQIRAIRERLNLSQPEASAIFGGGANAFSKYECGTVMQSVPMDRLLRVANEEPSILQYLKDRLPAELASKADAIHTDAFHRIVTGGYVGVATIHINMDSAETKHVTLEDSSYRSRTLRSKRIEVSKTNYKIEDKKAA